MSKLNTKCRVKVWVNKKEICSNGSGGGRLRLSDCSMSRIKYTFLRKRRGKNYRNIEKLNKKT